VASDGFDCSKKLLPQHRARRRAAPGVLSLRCRCDVG
jgi:hypothetical protein